jgi:DNA-binding NtrC family response regulator
MSLKVVLAIGVDSSLLEIQSSAWKSSGYIVTFAWSIKDAITHFRYGDFDLVLLGHSLPAESRERLTFLIRASGSRVPVVYIAGTSNDCDSSADATVKGEPTNILQEIEELLASRFRMPLSRLNAHQSLTLQATAR